MSYVILIKFSLFILNWSFELSQHDACTYFVHALFWLGSNFLEMNAFVFVLAAGFAGNGGGKKCACGMTQRCKGGEDDACHTDKNDHSWKMDEGVFVDKSVLPVSRMCVGYDTAGNPYRARNVYYLIRDLTCATAQFGSYIIIKYDMMWCGVMWCDVTRRDATRCDTRKHDETRCDTMRHDILRYDAMRCDTIRILECK